MIVKDELGISGRKEIQSVLENGEEVLFSCKTDKINVRNKRQKRNMLITNHHIYNLREGGLLTIFSNNAYIKRRIKLENIKGIVYAKLGNEFVIYVPSEFDYRIVSERKEIMIMYILYAISKVGISEIPFYFTDEIELDKYTTHNSQKKKGILNPPQGQVQDMSLAAFEEYWKEKIRQEKDLEKMTEMIISGNKMKITLNDFNLLKTLGKGGFGKV